MKILIIGEDEKFEALKQRLQTIETIEINRSEGNDDEDFEEYDAIFDLNFDDDAELLPIYAGLKNTAIFLSAVKLQLSEAVYTLNEKIKCQLYGINSIPAFIQDAVWEISLYRKFEMDELKKIMQQLQIPFLPIQDRVGLVKPRVIFMIINEACYLLQEGNASIEAIDTSMKLGTNYPYGPFEWCDKIGVTHVFESLSAIYDDTHDERYRICPLLKTKYLRNETFYKQKKQ